jgi:hypothetical protein
MTKKSLLGKMKAETIAQLSVYPYDCRDWNHNVAATEAVMLILPLCDRIHLF